MFFKLNSSDVIHHVSTAFLSTPLIILYHRYHSAVMAIWFMSGFPGMIDYFLLWLVKMGYLKSITEKNLCCYFCLYKICWLCCMFYFTIRCFKYLYTIIIY